MKSALLIVAKKEDVKKCLVGELEYVSISFKNFLIYVNLFRKNNVRIMDNGECTYLLKLTNVYLYEHKAVRGHIRVI